MFSRWQLKEIEINSLTIFYHLKAILARAENFVMD